jgi:hypothetical protein
MDDESRIQQEINKYKKFKKVDGATYRKVNQFLRKRTYITAREWALARLCTDFRTSGGAEMTFIGRHLPELVPFMEDSYSPQAVNQARNSFKKKVRKASATFFYGAMCGFFTTDELDDLLFEASEVSRFLLDVEGTSIDFDEEIDIEDRITHVMRGVGEAAKTILKNRSEEDIEQQEPPKRRGRRRKANPAISEPVANPPPDNLEILSVVSPAGPGMIPVPGHGKTAPSYLSPGTLTSTGSIHNEAGGPIITQPDSISTEKKEEYSRDKVDLPPESGSETGDQKPLLSTQGSLQLDGDESK